MGGELLLCEGYSYTEKWTACKGTPELVSHAFNLHFQLYFCVKASSLC